MKTRTVWVADKEEGVYRVVVPASEYDNLLGEPDVFATFGAAKRDAALMVEIEAMDLNERLKRFRRLRQAEAVEHKGPWERLIYG